MLSPWISQFIAVSNDLKKWLVDDVGISSTKITRIFNGVDTDAIMPTENKEQLKSALGLSPDTFVIGSVGRLDPVKDHETLMRAFQFVAGRNHDKKLSLIIVGTGPLHEKLNIIAKKLNISNAVQLTGERDNAIDLYNCMDIYVLPSVAEGISNTILEAMASGLPVIASNVGGNGELVDQARTGFLFSSGNHEELGNLVDRYLNNLSLLNKHGSCGRQRAVNNFSIRYMMDKYVDLYEAVFLANVF
jgi:glycosyltransferase involved in cell wall biosynthesis